MVICPKSNKPLEGYIGSDCHLLCYRINDGGIQTARIEKGEQDFVIFSKGCFTDIIELKDARLFLALDDRRKRLFALHDNYTAFFYDFVGHKTPGKSLSVYKHSSRGELLMLNCMLKIRIIQFRLQKNEKVNLNYQNLITIEETMSYINDFCLINNESLALITKSNRLKIINFSFGNRENDKFTLVSQNTQLNYFNDANVEANGVKLARMCENKYLTITSKIRKFGAFGYIHLYRISKGQKLVNINIINVDYFYNTLSKSIIHDFFIKVYEGHFLIFGIERRKNGGMIVLKIECSNSYSSNVGDDDGIVLIKEMRSLNLGNHFAGKVTSSGCVFTIDGGGLMRIMDLGLK